MRHSKRKKLNASDVDRAMKWYDAQPTFGYGGVDDPKYQYVYEADVYVEEDNVLDLNTLSQAEFPLETANDPTVTASWLAIEGMKVEEDKAMVSPQQSNLSPALLQYYNAITSVLLGTSEKSIQVRK